MKFEASFARKSFTVFMLTVFVLTAPFSMAPVSAQGSINNPFADDPALRRKNGVVFVEDSNPCKPSSNIEDDVQTAGRGNIYMIGDSITVGAKNALLSDFHASQNPYINASGGRAIRYAGQTEGFKTSGLQAAQDDKERIDRAGTVIISLGTNPETGFESAIKDLVEKVRSYNPDNPDMKIYWVNIFSLGGKNGYPKIEKDDLNKSIKKVAEAEKFQVIDMTGIDISLSDSIHPDAEGARAFSQHIVQSLNSGDDPNAPTVGADCVCGNGDEAGEAGLTGGDREEKIWNYFSQEPRSLTPAQVAGIMGNIAVESGYNPRALQPSTTGDYPVAGAGYGLVQWTDTGRQNNLIRRYNEAKDKDPNIKIYSLSFQLDHIWWELNNTEKGAFNGLKGATPSLTERSGTTYVFSHLYERPAAPDNPERGKAAVKALAAYGSEDGGVPTESGDISCQEKGAGASDEVTGEYSLPVAKKYYTNPATRFWFTKPHHDYPASDIPVPTGVSIFSMTNGTIIAAPNEGGYGRGVTIDAGSGVIYYYGHGSDGGSVRGAKKGDKVKAGQLIMHSDNTGQSSGPHLHLEIRVNGVKHCPQKLFVSIAAGSPIRESELPTSGCSN